MLFNVDNPANSHMIFSEIFKHLKQADTLNDLVNQLIADIGGVVNLLAYQVTVWDAHDQIALQKSYPSDGVFVCEPSHAERVFIPHPLGGQQFWVGFRHDGRLIGNVFVLTDATKLDVARHDWLSIWVEAVECCLSDYLTIYHLHQELQTLRSRQEFSIKIARRLAQAELAAAIAHQLNNPLTTIMGNIQMLLLDTPHNSPCSLPLQAISKSTTRMADVVRRLMSALYPPQSYSVPQPTDLLISANEAVQLIRNFIEAGKTTLVIELPTETIPLIWAESDALLELFFNLLMNARDAVVPRDGGVIGFSLVMDALRNAFIIQVWDNGDGIPEEEYDAIFEPFYSTKPSTERLGLGLHLCKQIVSRLGGAIQVAQHPSGGANFIVEIPFKRGL